MVANTCRFHRADGLEKFAWFSMLYLACLADALMQHDIELGQRQPGSFETYGACLYFCHFCLT
jgi:hypothetical protein